VEFQGWVLQVVKKLHRDRSLWFSSLRKEERGAKGKKSLVFLLNAKSAVGQDWRKKEKT